MSRAPADLVYSHAWISQCPECHGLLGMACFDPRDRASTQVAAAFAEQWDPVVLMVLAAGPVSWQGPGHQATCSHKRQART